MSLSQNSKSTFTFSGPSMNCEDTDIKKKTWGDNPPSCCTGNCKIESDFLIVECKCCGWDDGYNGSTGIDNVYEY